MRARIGLGRMSLSPVASHMEVARMCLLAFPANVLYTQKNIVLERGVVVV